MPLQVSGMVALKNMKIKKSSCIELVVLQVLVGHLLHLILHHFNKDQDQGHHPEKDKEEVQLVDMVLHIRSKLEEASGDLNLPDIVSERLLKHVETIVKMLPEDLQTVLLKGSVTIAPSPAPVSKTSHEKNEEESEKRAADDSEGSSEVNGDSSESGNSENPGGGAGDSTTPPSS